MPRKTRQYLRTMRGNAMITSVAILSTMMLGFALLGTFLTLERSQADLGAEQKYQAKESATSCVEIALIKLIQDPAYQGNENLLVDEVECTVRPIYKFNNQWTIEVQAQVGLQVQRYKVSVLSLSPTILSSWLEVISF